MILIPHSKLPLPATDRVGAASLSDGNGGHLVPHGAMPRQMTAICARDKSMRDLVGQATAERDVEKAICVRMSGPRFAAEKIICPGVCDEKDCFHG
jgi:alpha-galactosidase/6-phospho-beta-glucosidase family protein